MRIAILSDIHDHVWNLAAILKWLENEPPQGMIICGDLCSPFVLARIQNDFTHPIHMVFGNNDGDTFRITKLAAENVFIHGETAELVATEDELITRAHYLRRYAMRSIDDPPEGDIRIAVNHFPDIAFPLSESGRYDWVFYGHNHEHRIWQKGECLLVNPGPVMGYSPAGNKNCPATFVIADTTTPELMQTYQVLLSESGERTVSLVS
jgi:putative phosphoesterase